jgi:hypothetical protein
MFEGRAGLMIAVVAMLCAAAAATAQPQERQMGGVGITVYDDAGYLTVSQDVPNLAAYGMNNRVSSARPAGGRPR